MTHSGGPRYLCLVLAVLLLEGCFAYNVVRANPDGQQKKCSGFGLGILAPVAVAQRYDCVKGLERAGYTVDVIEPPVPKP